MSENPFENFSSSSQPAPAATPETSAAMPIQSSAPGGLTPIAVICLVLSIMGIFGSIIGMLSPLAMGFFEGIMESALESAPQAEREKQMQVFELSKAGLSWGVAFSIVNFLISIMMIIGAIQVLKKKGAGLLCKVTLVAAISLVITSVLQLIFVQLPMMRKTAEIMSDVPGQTVGQYIGLAFGLAFSLLFLGFYLWSHFYLKKDTVADYFASLRKAPRAGNIH